MNNKFNQSAKGFNTFKPHPHQTISHAGGMDTSGSVVRRLMLKMFGKFQPYADTRGNQPTPGAMANAYLGHYVGYQSYIGNAVACGFPPNPFQPGMMYVPTESFPVTGLGGLVNGEMLGQELLDPSNTDIPGI